LIQLENLTKAYGHHHTAVSDVSLTVESGEWMTLVGPSGSGKSTILKMVAGLTGATSGRILIDGRDVTTLAPQERDVAMVFQSYALYPHMSVRRNLEYGLRIRKAPRDQMQERVERVAGQLGISPLLDRRPGALSGGERQRVAMGRAMVRDPRAFLLDEPLSNLDAQLRVQVRLELAAMRDNLRTTTLYVTHDQVEAMTLGHRVAVLRGGVLQQVGTGASIFARPANRFVAGFMGSPPMNFVDSKVIAGTVMIGSARIPLGPDERVRAIEGRTVTVGFRPTDLEADAHCRDRDHPRLTCVVDVVEDLGTEKILGARAVAADGTSPAGGPFELRACVDSRTTVSRGDTLLLAVRPDALHVFDLGSEETILHRGGHEEG